MNNPTAAALRTTSAITSRSIAALTLALYASLSIAGPGRTCEKVEYAKLKDSSKKDLAYDYCDAMKSAKLNEDFYAINKELFDKQLALGANTTDTRLKMEALGEAQSSCLRAAAEASQMLTKKYKASAPSNCQAVFDSFK